MDLRSKVAERACQQEVERMKVDRFASPGRFNRKLVEKYLDGKSRNACPRTRRFGLVEVRQSRFALLTRMDISRRPRLLQ